MTGSIRFIQGVVLLAVVSGGEIGWVRSAETLADAWIASAVCGGVLLVAGWAFGIGTATVMSRRHDG